MTGRPRKERRALGRLLQKDARASERIFLAGPGGSKDRAILVASASLVEPQAKSTPCPLCGGELRVVEHAAEEGLRVARMRCFACGVPRSIWFRIAAPN